MFRPLQSVPQPPGAGLTKVADPRRASRGWVLALAALTLAAATLWPHGLGRSVDRARRQFVAIGYLRTAQAAAEAQPVRREAALASLKRAAALAPTSSAVADSIAQLYIGLRAYRESIPWLRGRAEQSLLAEVSLGQSLLMTGEREEGEGILTEVLAKAAMGRRSGRVSAPLYALLMNNVGYTHVLAGVELGEARGLIEEALKLTPRQPAYIDSLGWAEFRLGDFRNAAFHLERAVRLYLPQESAEIYYHLGAAYARLGRKPEARLALERSLQLDRSLDEAARELDQLSQELPHPALARGLAPRREPQSASTSRYPAPAPRRS